MKKFFLFALFSFFCISAFAEFEQGGEYYTNVNIWYKNRAEILTTYHVGGIIPAGTKVKLLRFGRAKVLFEDVETDIQYRLVEPRKFSARIAYQDWLAKYFSNDNPLDYDGYTELEREAIKKGEIKYGMTKRAVLTAYGYPPTHRTISTSANRWFYWSSKLMSFAVDFDDDKVVKIKGKTENEAKKSKRSVAVEQSPPNLTDELRKLGELYNMGLLTEEEFTDAKRKLIY